MKLGNLSLFHTPGEQAFASVRVGRHHETWPLKSSGFRNLLSHQFYRSVGKVPNSQALQAALAVLAGRARFDGEEHLVFVRVAEHEGKTFVDLCDREWRAVEVTAEGWSVVAKPPVRFRRARGMLPLPEPAPGGKIQDIWTFVNIKSGGDRLLFLAWLVAALRAHGPYPILVLNGEHGTAKTTAEKVARQLIDPSEAPLRTTPRDERDLMIAARNSHVIGFDNLSWLPTWLADALCRLATGGGLATRELYTDDEEVIFDAQRPVLLNGIEELPTRGDFVDRQIALHLPEIHETKRKTEESFWADFGFAHPRILGALFDAVSAALRAYPSVKFRRLPRMADFAKWASAAEQGLGFKRGSFMRAYTKNRAEANQVVLESSRVAQAILALLSTNGNRWEGTIGDLLKELNEQATEKEQRCRSWPDSPKGLSNALARLAPNLRVAGVSYSRLPREAGTGRRLVRFEKAEDSSQPSHLSHSKGTRWSHDDGRDVCDDAGPNCENGDDMVPFEIDL